jgi:hypothetical protein
MGKQGTLESTKIISIKPYSAYHILLFNRSPTTTTGGSFEY